MASEEKFGRLKIESPSTIPGWEGEVPFLDYWSLSYRGLKLNDNQQKFYDFLKEKVERGEKISMPLAHSYFSLLRDDILKRASKTKTRAQAVVQAKNLVKVFNFKDNALCRVLADEALQMGHRRLNRYKRGKAARWIPLGESVDTDGRTLTRGGFYLGTFLTLSEYNVYSEKFHKRTIPVEGPVVNLSALDPEVDRDLLEGYTTYVEMPVEAQNNLLDYLEGKDAVDNETIRYYVAGIENRLLADASTPEEERIALLRHLYSIVKEVDTHTIQGTKLVGQINSLIHFCLARYFYRDPYAVMPDLDLNQYWLLMRSMLQNAIASVSASEVIDDETLVNIAHKILPVPTYLPKVYEEAFRKNISGLIYHPYRRFYKNENDGMVYMPISTDRAYHPAADIVSVLSKKPMGLRGVDAVGVEKIVEAYSSTIADLLSFKSAVGQGKNVVEQADKLPSWCDRSLMPSLKDAVAEISPVDGTMMRTVPLRSVLSTIGFRYYQSFEGDEMKMLNIKLAHVGLCVANPGIKKMKYDPDAPVVVYPSFCGEMSKRGTLPVSLVLVAWLVTADKASDADLAIVDSWLKDIVGAEDKAVPAMALFRWLTYRKIVMSQRRKVKAATLAKFAKRRDELIKLLLTIVSDPDRANPKRMKRLETIYSLVGLDPSKIHSDMHRLATDGSPQSSKGHAATKGARDLDKSKLRAMAQSTLKAQEILSEVFDTGKDSAQETVPIRRGDTAARSGDTPVAEQIETASDVNLQKTAVSTQENSTLVLLKLLVNKTEWSREEFSRLCAEHGDTAGSMLERLNDLAYDALDEPVAEDADDVIYIDADVAEKLLS